MNLLLWATHLTEEHYPYLEKIKSTGFDGVEIPIFAGDDTHYQKLRRKLDELQLQSSTVTVACRALIEINGTSELMLSAGVVPIEVHFDELQRIVSYSERVIQLQCPFD